MPNYRRLQLRLYPVLLLCVTVSVRADEITHSFLACGQKTYILDGQGKNVWNFSGGTRDGYVLKNGHVLLTVNKSQQYPGGGVLEVSPTGEETLIWKGTQSEVNSAQPTPSGTFVLTEAGPNPRLLEIDRSGKILVEFLLQCQQENHHMQTRMARKLDDGTFLVPHLLNFAVINYRSDGTVLSSLDTNVPGDSERKIHSWPFTAIRHSAGRTLVCCTNGNRVLDFNAQGKLDWQLTNEDLPGPWLQDPCGAQVLPNGNIVITNYAAGRVDRNAPKLLEVTRDKKVVWTYVDVEQTGIHHFQILDTNGQPLEGLPLK